MNFCRLIVFAFFCLPLVGVASSSPANAKEMKLGWNVGNAANFMYATYQIDGNASGKKAIPERLRAYNLTYYRQWHNRFKEDLDFLMAVNKTHVFIAFRGTSNDANRKMNNVQTWSMPRGCTRGGGAPRRRSGRMNSPSWSRKSLAIARSWSPDTAWAGPSPPMSSRSCSITAVRKKR